MKQYEIWWATLPEPAGRRPVLILSRDGAHRYLSSVLVVEITSTVRGVPQEVVLGAPEGLSRRCVANFDNVRTLHLGGLDVRLGGLRARRVREVKRAMGHALMWPELTRIADDPYA